MSRALIDRRGAPAGVLRHMRRHLHGAQFIDEVFGVIGLVGAQRDRSWSIRARLDHMKRRDAFGVSVRRRQASVDEEPVPVLHQRVTDKAEFRLLAGPFAIEPRFGIARGHMRFVRSLLAVKIRLFVAAAALGRRVVRPILRIEALHRRPSLNQRAVDREVLRA